MRELIERAQLAAKILREIGGQSAMAKAVDECAAALEAAREDACVALVADIRFACGDNGKRMQPELVEFIRGLAEDAERWRFGRDRGFPVFGYFDIKIDSPEWGICVAAGVTHKGRTPEDAIDQARGKEAGRE